MRKTVYLIIPLFALPLMTVSCRMAPKEELGDTVAAKVFEPIDTAALHRKQATEMKTLKTVPTSSMWDLPQIRKACSSSAIPADETPSR